MHTQMALSMKISLRQDVFITHSESLALMRAHPNYSTCTAWPNAGMKMSTNQLSRKPVRLLPKCSGEGDYSSTRDLVDDPVLYSIDDYIINIKRSLSSMADGRISVSPYDTAWIALIKDTSIDENPMFPSTLEWIAENQHIDGSWGDEHFFSVFDRLVNTLACVVALKSWELHPHKMERGITFIRENIHQLETANFENATCGFEVALPTLFQKAKNMGIDDIPYEAPVIRDIFAAKLRKMKRIPKELIHKLRTPALHCLEGYEDLDWQKLLHLQEANGSFLHSPAATAYAYMETKDNNCLRYINYVIQELKGAAPNVYPVGFFARLWAVDRLQRLGISRHFDTEIRDCLSHIYRFWTGKGIFCGRDSAFADIDDTCMGFRLLRLHGYDIDPNVLSEFVVDNKFCCYAGELFDGLSPIFNLYRASQVLFPGEKILEEAKDFSDNFLREKLACNQLLDKWVISETLPDEIRTGLEIPFYSNLPRIETRFYLEQYGGANDIWIGKCLYRMPDVSNNDYLELAKLDFRRCQAQHQTEWTLVQEWYDACNVQAFGITRKDLLMAFFLAAASIFEPEKSKERIVWVKSQIISKMTTYLLRLETTLSVNRPAFLMELRHNIISGANKTNKIFHRDQGLITILKKCILQFLDGYDEHTSHQLKTAWGAWLMALHQGNQEDGELLATVLNICAAHDFQVEILSNHEYKTLSKLTNRICQRLSEYQNEKGEVEEMGYENTTANMKDNNLEHDMQTLLHLALKESGGISKNIKQTFLQVAKTFHYWAYTPAESTQMHIFKVLFDPIF